MKAWLLRWFGAISVAEIDAIDANHQKLVREFESHKLESDAAISELIAELNLLRNSIPVVPQTTSRPVRVFRNFREFRTAVETRPIKSERKTS